MKWWHYTVLGVLSYLFFLLASLPAAVLWHSAWVQQQAGSFATALSVPNGSLWRGSTMLHWQGENYPLSWQFSARWLWRAELAIDLNTKQSDVQAAAVLVLSPRSLGLRDVQAKIGENFLNQQLAAQGIRLSAPVSVAVQQIRWKKHGFSEAQGSLSWEGGPLRYRAPALKEVSMPRLLGNLSSTPEGHLLLSLVAPEQSASSELLALRLSAEGLGALQVRRRFMDVLGQSWSAQSQPEDVVFEATQQF